jgi:hypothetical protein
MKPDLYGLTEEQLMVRETIRKFVEKEVVPLVEEAENEGSWVCFASGIRWKWEEGVRIRCQNAFSQRNLIGFARGLQPVSWFREAWPPCPSTNLGLRI